MNLSTVILVCVFILPLLWSGVIQVVRIQLGYYRSTQKPQDRMEKTIFFLMVFPAFTGAACITISSFLAAPVDIATTIPRFVPEFFAGAATSSPGLILHLDKVPTQTVAVLFWIYSLVAIALLARIARQHRMLMQIMRRARAHQFTDGQRILVTTEDISPFAYGRDSIVIPECLIARLPQAQIALIIAHERRHLQRRDTFYFLFLAVSKAIFWFNPFVRSQIKRCRIAAEIDCDNSVVSRHPQHQKSYAEALIATLETLSPVARTPITPSLHHNSSGEFAMRIKNIVSGESAKPSTSKRALALLAAGSLMLTGVQAAFAIDTDSGPPIFSALVLDGRITSQFGLRKHPLKDEMLMHNGTDIKAAIGTPVSTPADGRVIRAEMVQAYGMLLEIAHSGGYVTRYAQLNSFTVSVGEHVDAGQIVATVGASGQATGPHLHIEVIKDGEYIDPASVLELPAR